MGGSNLFTTALDRTKGLQVPKGGSKNVQLVLGIVNIFLFGVGTFIGGILDGEMADVLIGVFQLFLPLVGWIWSIIWGIRMIMQKD